MPPPLLDPSPCPYPEAGGQGVSRWTPQVESVAWPASSRRVPSSAAAGPRRHLGEVGAPLGERLQGQAQPSAPWPPGGGGRAAHAGAPPRPWAAALLPRPAAAFPGRARRFYRLLQLGPRVAYCQGAVSGASWPRPAQEPQGQPWCLGEEPAWQALDALLCPAQGMVAVSQRSGVMSCFSCLRRALPPSCCPHLHPALHRLRHGATAPPRCPAWDAQAGGGSGGVSHPSWQVWAGPRGWAPRPGLCGGPAKTGDEQTLGLAAEGPVPGWRNTREPSACLPREVHDVPRSADAARILMNLSDGKAQCFPARHVHAGGSPRLHSSVRALGSCRGTERPGLLSTVPPARAFAQHLRQEGPCCRAAPAPHCLAGPSP